MQHCRSAVLDWVYPFGVTCLCCEQPSRGALLCPLCQRNLDMCRLSQRAGVHRTEAYTIVSVWQHSECPRVLVHRLKFEQCQQAGLLLAKGMAEAAAERSLHPCTVVTWVPMPEKRRKQRGIDHARFLAEQIAQLLALEAMQLLARESNAMPTQRGLTRSERLRNVKHAFRAMDVADRRVLLVDDVTTTGATLHACVSCLLQAGAKRVDVVTATRAMGSLPVQSTECNHQSVSI